jgi:hypothetical protein
MGAAEGSKRVRKPGQANASGRVHDEEEHEGNLKFEVSATPCAACLVGQNGPLEGTVVKLCSPYRLSRSCWSGFLRFFNLYDKSCQLFSNCSFSEKSRLEIPLSKALRSGKPVCGRGVCVGAGGRAVYYIQIY